MGVKHKKPVGVMANSQVPYAKRLQMQRELDIYHNREDAARTAMKVACVALNDTMGMGFQRLCQFGARFNELIDEFYSDREVSEYHLNQRLREIGFQMGENGEGFTMQGPDGKFVKPEEADSNA